MHPIEADAHAADRAHFALALLTLTQVKSQNKKKTQNKSQQ